MDCQRVHPSFATLTLNPSPCGRDLEVSVAISVPLLSREKGLGAEVHQLTKVGCTHCQIASLAEMQKLILRN
jgi:hypothetical protein